MFVCGGGVCGRTVTDDVRLGIAGVAVAETDIVEGVAAGIARVAGAAARVGRGVCSFDGVARGVVRTASGCPQLVNTSTSNRSLQQRTTSHVLFRTIVLKLYYVQSGLSIPDRPLDTPILHEM